MRQRKYPDLERLTTVAEASSRDKGKIDSNGIAAGSRSHGVIEILAAGSRSHGVIKILAAGSRSYGN